MEEKGSVEKDDMQIARDTLYSLLLGTLASGLALVALGTILYPQKSAFLLGGLLGLVTACGIALHLYRTIGRSLDLAPEQSAGYTRRMALLRLGLMGLPVILSVMIPEIIHPLGVLIGILGLKAGALLQPAFLRLIQKRRKEGEREC